ncbi:hybrid sensor histidine kinase/response regulator [Flavobacterium nitratireducens]|uniref:ATP-binding response regulator n=1 Tax=Flavobacterium nitratireducens TaxID=992289 RepID=UPI002414D27E|nr:hybrid sensor histidine kinase/response regulator [Flavobacterium nitratireducens]
MNKNKILLVEDEINLRETICEYLKYEDYDVVSAENGQEALDILDYWIPDLILCDIMMPVMDGHQFHEILMQNTTLNAIPFIFLTAKKEDNIREKCIYDGVDEFISKPFKFDELTKMVNAKIKRFKKIKKSYNNVYTGSKNVFLHEINTPLNGILGSIELLIENEESFDKDDKATFYEAIKISGERLNRTMRNVILFQNIKNNTIEFNEDEQSNLLDCFAKVRKALSPYYENSKKRLRADLVNVEIKMNSEFLEFVLYELIDNALKFSNTGKQVSVAGSIYNDKYYELNITDYGLGFKPEELKSIEPNKQFNREQMEQQGLGLGLYLSRIVVLKSKGLFSIVSKEGEGTKITLLLPISK